ncbi:hypothetical protein BJ165DRAFT_1530351 [Panaeolus papilionaceus]|nr:hypothetical protein BJ165DRAFT_1530351 [Panaeolus papilionaceus]
MTYTSSQTSHSNSKPLPVLVPASTGNASPKSNKPTEVITDFHWAQYLAPYDKLAEANFELPRVPHIQIDLEKRTVHMIKPKSSEKKVPADTANTSVSVEGKNANDNSDVMVIDRAAVEATKRNEVLKMKEESVKRAELTRTPSVKRAIQRMKL